MSFCCLTSIFAMTKMRRHRHQPLLSHAHTPQGKVQPVNHFVRPQHHVLKVFMVVSEENNQTNSGGAKISIDLKQIRDVFVTHEEKSSVPSTSVQL